VQLGTGPAGTGARLAYSAADRRLDMDSALFTQNTFGSITVTYACANRLLTTAPLNPRTGRTRPKLLPRPFGTRLIMTSYDPVQPTRIAKQHGAAITVG